MDIGKRIKELREAQGLSGRRLAKQAGITQSTLYAIEAEGAQPTVPTLEAICQGLGISLSDFFKENTLPGNEDMLIATYLGNQIASLPENRKKLIKELIDDWENSGVKMDALTPHSPVGKEHSKSLIAKRIRHARVEKGLTIPHFSDLTQIGENRLAKFEEGTEIPSIKELNAILAALEISPLELLHTQEPDVMEVRFDPLSAELQEQIKQAIYEGGEVSFTLKFKVVDVLKDGESVLPVEMREPKVDETTNTHTTGDGGVEGGEQYVSPQTDVEGSALTEVPEPRPKPQTRRKVETLAAHRSDDPMTDLPDEAWENVQELLEFHKHEVEKERNKPKK